MHEEEEEDKSQKCRIRILNEMIYAEVKVHNIPYSYEPWIRGQNTTRFMDDGWKKNKVYISNFMMHNLVNDSTAVELLRFSVMFCKIFQGMKIPLSIYAKLNRILFWNKSALCKK